MPRRKAAKRPTTSAFRQVQQQARSLLINLRKEIRNTESDLNRLKDEESRLSALIGVAGAGGRRAPRAGGGGRIDWRAVLGQLPRQFKASDVRKLRGLKEKRPSEIFAAITRWIEAGIAKRKTRGVYERA